MMAVPRPSNRAADQDADTHVNGTADPLAAPPAEDASTSEAETSLLPVLAEQETALLPSTEGAGPKLKVDPGLYAILGLDPGASDDEIRTTYRRMASKLVAGGYDNQALKQLNHAYEVLGNPVRRADYDRIRTTLALAPGGPTPIRPGAKVATRSTKRRRPRHAVQPRYPGLGDVIVVLTVVGLAVIAGFLLIPRLTVNLSALNALQAVLPLSSNARPVLNVTVTAVPTAEATATPEPSVSAQYASSNVTVSNPTPAQNSSETVQLHLRHDGQPVPGADVWASVQYRTTTERWPATGTVKTDNTGAASVTFNIGAATPNYPVTVHIFTQVGDQQLSWTTTFTPH